MESDSEDEAYSILQNDNGGSSSTIGNRTYECQSWDELRAGSAYQRLNASETVIIPQRFSGSSLIDILHDSIPRFGESSNITEFFVGGSQDRKSYLLGLVYFAILVICIFLLWCLVLLFFRIRGAAAHGWLSGSRMPFPPQPDKCEEGEDEQSPEDIRITTTTIGTNDHQTWHDRYTKRVRQNYRMKIAISLACLGIIVADILMLVFGVPGLHAALGNALNALDMALGITDKGLQVLDQLVQFGDSSTLVVGSLMDILQDMRDTCPTQDELLERICTGQPQNKCIYGSDWFEKNEIYNTVTTFLEDVDQYLIWELGSFQSFLFDYQESLLWWYRTFQNLTWIFAVALTAALLLVFMTGGIILPMLFVRDGFIRKFPRTRRCIHCCIVPAFFMLVVLSFGFALGFVLAAISLSDACHGDVDKRMFRIATEQLDTSDLPFHRHADEFLRWYLSRCETEPGYELEKYLWKGSRLLADLSEEIDDGALENIDFDSFCNRTAGVAATNNFTNISDSTALLVGEVSDGLCQMAGVSFEVRSLFACTTWYPLYSAIVHQSMCGSVSEFAWVAMTQAVVVLMAMVVLTLRVVIYQDVEVKELDKPASVDIIAEDIDKHVESRLMPPIDKHYSESDNEYALTSENEVKAGDSELVVGDWFGHIDTISYAVSS